VTLSCKPRLLTRSTPCQPYPREDDNWHFSHWEVSGTVYIRVTFNRDIIARNYGANAEVHGTKAQAPAADPDDLSRSPFFVSAPGSSSGGLPSNHKTSLPSPLRSDQQDHGSSARKTRQVVWLRVLRAGARVAEIRRRADGRPERIGASRIIHRTHTYMLSWIIFSPGGCFRGSMARR